MEGERWEVLKTTFDELLELDGVERSARLATLAGTDPELLEQVSRLLAADASAERRLRRLEIPFSPDADSTGVAAPPTARERAAGAADEVRDPFGLSGRTITHFQVQRVLGGGGMGVLYCAEDLRLGRSVALKFLLPQFSLDVLAKERFLQEARAASALDHPHICTIHEAGETEQGQLFLAMSYYAGETLRERLTREGALPLQEAIELTRQIASGLGAAHAAGIVHRDLKPGNLMLTAGGVLKILDFGLAKVRDLSLTGSGMRPGTVAYMSPEQLQSETVEVRSDLWSLGVVLYEMLTGRQPFGAGHELSTVYRILHEEPAPPSTLRAEIPAELEEVVLRLLRREPGERPSSAAEVLEALEAVRSALSFAQEGSGPSRSASSGRSWHLPALAGLAGRRQVQVLSLGGMLVLGLLGTVAVTGRVQQWFGAFGGGVAETLVGRGLLVERERILLADFTSPTGDSLEAALAGVAFRVDLAQSPMLTLVETRQVREALGRMERPEVTTLDLELAREVALREGIKAVLAGEIARGGSGYLLSARLLAAESGETLASERETAADSTALIEAIDRLSSRMRERIGESLRSIQSKPPLARATTGSLEALRKYSQALHALDVQGEEARGVALLEEAIALDSAFAMAHVRLAVALRNRATTDERDRMVQALSRAYRHRDRLTDRERYGMLARYYSLVTAEREQAITATRLLLASHPDDRDALNSLAMLYFEIRDFTRAEEFARRAWQADSSTFPALLRLLMAQFYQGKYEEADATLQHFAIRFPGQWRITHYSVLMAAARGEYARADSLARAERRARPEDSAFQANMAGRLTELAFVRGHWSDAQRHIREQNELYRRQDMPGSRHVAFLAYGRMEINLRGEPAVRRLRRELAEYPLSEVPFADRPYLLLAIVHARAGQPQQARALLAEWKALVPADQQRADQPSRDYALGEIALAEGRPLDAVREFHQSNLEYRMAHIPVPTTVLPLLGHAFDQAGQADSAIVYYERYLDTPDLFRMMTDAEWLALVLERLGQLHEARGNRTAAARYYTAFLELWQSADAELQPRVREARRRVAVLQGA
jgi:eukaryotic-like serine/threonine-protein kinase